MIIDGRKTYLFISFDVHQAGQEVPEFLQTIHADGDNSGFNRGGNNGRNTDVNSNFQFFVLILKYSFRYR